MIENSASPRPEAIEPITADDEAISPATGACTSTVPPSGRLSRASVWPAVTVSPASASTSITFSPSRSGLTAVSSRARTMPDTSTIAGKQALVAFSTVTVAPFGAASASSARPGCAATQHSAAAVIRAFMSSENLRPVLSVIDVSFPFSGKWIPERGPRGEAGRDRGGKALVTRITMGIGVRCFRRSSRAFQTPGRQIAKIAPAHCCTAKTV